MSVPIWIVVATAENGVIGMDGDMPPMPDGMDDMASHMDQAAADTAPAYDPADTAAATADTGDMPDMPPPPDTTDDIV